jgi:homoserine O-succinyltransferase
LTEVLDWAESNTASAILSCLAAHAGVLHSDGIDRHRLSDKQFGVFDFARTGLHQLNANTGERVQFPHSRWNEVRADELTACGYTVLTQSIEGGVDSFVKKRKQSLFVHFQGHPEYGAHTLLKEYRRDIRRFLKNERETYPTMPKGYFDTQAEQLLLHFRDAVFSGQRREERMHGFPDQIVVGGLQKTWHSSAVSFYRNWLEYVVSRKADGAAFPAMAAVSQRAVRKGSVLS